MRSIKVFLLLVFITLFSTNIFGNNIIKVNKIVGKAEVLLLSQNQRRWRVAEENLLLNVNDKIRTGKDGKIILNYKDYDFTLLPGSLLLIKSLPTTNNKILELNLKYGKLRSKSISSNKNKNYSVIIISPNSRIKLKGTDVVIESTVLGNEESQIIVFDGKVEVSDLSGKKIAELNKNQMLDIKRGSSNPVIHPIPDEKYNEYNIEKTIIKPEKKKSPQIVKKPEPKPKKVSKKRPEKPVKKEPWCKDKSLSLGLNMDIQYLNVNKEGYLLVAFIPDLGFCKIGLGLYLPIIFSIERPKEFFYSKKWYNHSDWNFMSFSDSLHDLIIKFIYVRYGKKGDPFYIRVGSLPDVTFGNGFIMNQYSNMIDFPTIRRVGVEVGFVYKNLAGIELFSSDISKNKLLGYRLHGYPLGWNKNTSIFKKLDIGQTLIMDKEACTSKDKVINWGFDLSLPLLQLPILNLRYGMDWAKYSVYSPSLLGKDSWESSPGWGFTTGVRGNLLMIQYKAEYRYLKDNYIPEYFDSFYEVSGMRETKFLDLISNMYDSDSRSTLNGYFVNMGFKVFGAGEVGANFQEYYGKDASIQNKAQIYLTLDKGIIPLFYGTASYNKMNVVGVTGSRGLFGSLYSENTILTFDGGIKFLSFMYLKVYYQKTFYYDDNGNLQSNITYSVGMNFGF